MKIAITYVGKDQRYFETFKQDMSEEYSAYTLAFRSYQVDDESNFIDLFEKIKTELPNILFLDFSTDSEQMTKLLNLFVAFQSEKVTLIGLYPQLDHDKNRQQLMNSNLEGGVHANIVKSGTDFIEPIYLGMRLACPDLMKKSSFFELKFKDGEKAKLIDIGKLNFITKDEIECETNLALKVGDEVEIENHLPIDIVESKIFKCTVCENRNLFYRRYFKQRFSPIYLDYIFEKEDANKLERAKIADDKERREHLIETKNKPEFEQWVLEQAGEPKPKLVKLAVIDHNLCPIKHEHLIDSDVEFSCRVWASAEKSHHELFKYIPDILVFQMEEMVERNDVNSENALERMIEFLKSNGMDPYLIVFGAKENTETLKNTYGYSKMMAYPDDIFINAIVGMIKSFNSKRSDQLAQVEDTQFVPASDDQLSTFSIEHDIKILRISEYDIDFELDRELEPGAFFKMKVPADMVVRITTHLERSPHFNQKGVHHGVFHTISNDEKKKLRQYIQQKKD